MLYERRGHGRSDRTATGYDIDTMADDLAAVIGYFDLHDATLVAHSLGSKEAIRYLTRHGWCEMRGCGNRAKAARYYRRHRHDG